MSDEVPPTGDARVDAVLESLQQLADLPVDAHAEVYDQIHGQLRAVLTQAGDQGPPRPSAP
ncbi:MAG: hypothetical protein Q7T56_15220 [Nocardioidaceae bacterium]|nr:hypothetical protein [Nocardioidaceae bacterium]